MNAVIWILIAVSDGMYNRGTVTVVARFATEAECVATVGRVPKTRDALTSWVCLRADGAKP